MQLFGNRLHNNTHRRGTLSPLAIILICAGAAFLLTIIIGLVLNVSLDDEAYERLTKGEQKEEEQNETNKSYTRDIHADAYVFGEEGESVWENLSEISITLNTPTGQINYTSEVATFLGMESIKEHVLYDAMGEVNLFANFVGGVFYPQALYREGSDLQYAAAAKECALMKEFLHAGGNEILLCGIPFSRTDTASILRYVKQIKAMAGDSPIGVAVPLAIARADGAWTLLESLAKECDFLAIDLTETASVGGAEQILTDARYYIQQYDMRVVLSEVQEDLIVAAFTYPDVQIITHYAPALPPTPDQPIQ
ncbi:MAG: hypothetical protein E7584_05425 [Ruminococcaceae bacterium]|nr:hypothetical protein [Oscillospiraceae bacterium]